MRNSKNTTEWLHHQQEKFKYAPLELQTVSKQFKSLAQAVVSSQEKLKLSNETLTEQVNLRTASLNKRNEELKSLQLMLAPLEEPPKIVIGKTIERFKEILSLEVLYFTDAEKYRMRKTTSPSNLRQTKS